MLESPARYCRCGGELVNDETRHDDADDDRPGALRRTAGLLRSAATGTASFISDKRFDRKPAGKARKAREAGAATFHIRLDLDDITHRSDGHSTREPGLDDVIGSIEAEGWALDQLQYVTESDEHEHTDDKGLPHRDVEQRTSAVLLFRRT